MKVFLIGCGDIARHHGRAIVRLGGEIIGGFDISQQSADLVSQEFGCPCCTYEEIEENVVKADYVVISTPPTKRLDYVEMVLKHHIPLYMEKPVACTMEDAMKIKAMADEYDGRIMVGGESAGGGLTAALCMYARDKSSVNIAYQMPLYPMLDDRDTESSRDNHAPIWNTKRNHAAWKLYLKGLTDIPPYAAPARQTDYTDLPPTYTFVGDIEPFYCETLTYIENLKAAGVEASVDVYPNWFHAYDMFFPFKAVAKQAIAKFEKQFCYAAEHYFAPQNKA